MTSNQVAAAQVRVQERSADEQARHNAAVEEETNRANQANEDINYRKLALDEERTRLENEWNTERNRIQEEYNKLYLELQRAQEWEKINIQQQLAEIERRKAAAEEKYKDRMGAVAISEERIHELEEQERERSNRAQEALKSRQLDIDDWGKTLQAKQIEYQNTFWTGQLQNQSISLSNQMSFWNASLAKDNLALAYEHERNMQNYELQLYKLGTDLNRLQLDTYLGSKQLGVSYLNTMLQGLNTLNNVVQTATFVLKPFGGK